MKDFKMQQDELSGLTRAPVFTGSLVSARPFWHQLKMLTNPALFFEKLIARYGDYVRYRGVVNFHLVNHPALVGRILRETHRNFDKATPIYHRFRNAFGDGLVTAEGERWKKRRKLIQPVFKGSAIENFFSLMRDATDSAVDAWSTNTVFNIADEMDQLALTVAGRSFFGRAFDESSEDIRRWTDVINRYCALPPLSIISNLKVPTPMNLKLRGVLGEYDQFLGRLIRERTEGFANDDLLGILLNAMDEETGEGLNPKDLAEEVLGMLIAGHETTGKALTWVWHELNSHPEVEKALREEIETVTGGGPLKVEHLKVLRKLTMVIEETLRLHPPAWFENRNTLEDIELGGEVLPKGTMVVFSRYSLQRHPDFWIDSEIFKPERFDPEDAENAHNRHASVPFGGGPRVCIGRHFAMMEIKVVVATVLRHFQVVVDSSDNHEMCARMTMAPRHGLRVHLKRREQNQQAKPVIS